MLEVKVPASFWECAWLPQEEDGHPPEVPESPPMEETK
jgi:hypothetical protein